MVQITVIMPSLNMVSYIEECLKSVIGQTQHNIEILCVDAGSTDGTVEVIKSYMKIDNRIRLLHSEVKSYGYQLNIGLDNAKGEYIAIVETDDFVPENMLDTLLRTAESSKADFVKAGFSSFGSFNGKRYFSSVVRKVPKGIWNMKVDLNRHPEIGLCDINHIWTGLYKKNFLIEKKIRFNETPGASFQDVSFSILVGLLADSCVYIEDIVYMYRIDNAGSSVKSDEKVRCVIDEFEYIVYVLEKVGKYTQEIKQLLAHQKIATYSWNFYRLTWPKANIFLGLIENELQELKLLVQNDVLEPYESENLRRLCSKEYFSFRKEDDFCEVVKLLRGLEDIVLIGAGSYAEHILLTAEMLKSSVIRAIADNSIQKQGTILMGYEIISVEQVVKEYSCEKYLIACKTYSKDIKNQLLQMGIKKKQIVEINAYPGLSEIIYNLKGMRIDCN